MSFSETDPVAISAGGGAGGGISLCGYTPIISFNMFMISANHHQFTPATVAAAAPFMAAQHKNKFMGYPPGLSLGQGWFDEFGQPWFVNQPSMADVGFESVDSRAVGVREDELDSKSRGSKNAECAVFGSGEDHEGGERRPQKKRCHRRTQHQIQEAACASGKDHEGGERQPWKKRCHGHTQHQIQEMATFFKECPHPNDKQRKELSRELGLDHLQVRFWFQNKRTQMKTHFERMENSQLKAENERLMAEIMRYKEALSHASCTNCDEHQLRLENARLRQEVMIIIINENLVEHLDFLYCIDRQDIWNCSRARGEAAEFAAVCDFKVGRPGSGHGRGPGCSEMFGVNSANVSASAGIGDRCLALGFAPTGMERPVVTEPAVVAMKEFIGLSHIGSPLWNFSTHPDSSTAVEILNENEYARSFPACGIIGPRPYGFRAEASRASGTP